MTIRKIHILNGHPMKTSLSFESDFGVHCYKQGINNEPVLKAFAKDLEWADQIVIATPLWWGGIPAKLKGLFDRILLPSFAYDPRNKKMGLPRPMLTGKTAHVMLTADTPMWAMRLMYNRAIQNQLTRQILAFVGIKPTKHSHYAPVEHIDSAKISKLLDEAKLLGQDAA